MAAVGRGRCVARGEVWDRGMFLLSLHSMKTERVKKAQGTNRRFKEGRRGQRC